MVKMLRVLVSLSLLTFVGCGRMMMTEPGALTGLTIDGVPGICGPDDRFVLLDSYDAMLFNSIELGSGSLAWNPRTRTIDGSAECGVDWTQQAAMLRVLGQIAQTYGSDLYCIEFNNHYKFNFSVLPTSGNVLLWVNPLAWFVGTREVSVSALLKKRRALP